MAIISLCRIYIHPHTHTRIHAHMHTRTHSHMLTHTYTHSTDKCPEFALSRVANLEQYLSVAGSFMQHQPRSLPSLMEAWHSLIPSHIKQRKAHSELPLLVSRSMQWIYIYIMCLKLTTVDLKIFVLWNFRMTNFVLKNIRRNNPLPC